MCRHPKSGREPLQALGSVRESWLAQCCPRNPSAWFLDTRETIACDPTRMLQTFCRTNDHLCAQPFTNRENRSTDRCGEAREQDRVAAHYHYYSRPLRVARWVLHPVEITPSHVRSRFFVPRPWCLYLQDLVHLRIESVRCGVDALDVAHLRRPARTPPEMTAQHTIDVIRTGPGRPGVSIEAAQHMLEKID